MAWYLKYAIPLIFSITLNFTATRAQGLSYQYQVCSTNKFTPNSTFQRDLTTLFSSLSSTASSNVEFFNNTVTAGTNSSDTVYGLFMCRGDIPSDLCNHCVGNATQRLSTHADCTLSKAAVVYYDECIVRYSNRSFFSTLTMQAGYALWNPTNMTNQESFKRLLYDTMNKTADDAAHFPTGAKKFATRETSIDIFQKLYCLAQCTQDLFPGDCRSCLDSLINSDLPGCCAGSQGGRVYYPNCIIRFEIYPFFRSLPTAPTPSPAGLVPPTNSGVGEESSTLQGLQFDLVTIKEATNNFSPRTRLEKVDLERFTSGYMSPEYAMFGQFSEKSDVFSFGIMILEIITGKKNGNSYKSNEDDGGLMSNVWRNWTNQTPLSILEPNMKENYFETEVIRCIEIGLLCVQENPNMRPTIAEVVSYLNDLTIELPSPQEPAFFSHGIDQKAVMQQESSSNSSVIGSMPFSVNEMSISDFYPR
ncbi:hypothetical protein ACSQ67_013890 [Phaseolus vulgaris]